MYIVSQGRSLRPKARTINSDTTKSPAHEMKTGGDYVKRDAWNSSSCGNDPKSRTKFKGVPRAMPKGAGKVCGGHTRDPAQGLLKTWSKSC